MHGAFLAIWRITYYMYQIFIVILECPDEKTLIKKMNMNIEFAIINPSQF